MPARRCRDERCGPSAEKRRSLIARLETAPSLTASDRSYVLLLGRCADM
jgi:hypothetical protein